MANFCTSCGMRLDPATGRCPRCHPAAPAPRPAPQQPPVPPRQVPVSQQPRPMPGMAPQQPYSPVAQRPYGQPPVPAPPKKKTSLWMILLILSIAVALSLVVWLCITLFAGDREKPGDKANLPDIPISTEPEEIGPDIPEDAVSFQDKHYLLIPDGTVDSYEAARRYCQELGGDLAVITSREENAFLYDYVADSGCTNAYFGLTDAAASGSWQWVNDRKVDYTNWNRNANLQKGDYAMFYTGYSDGTWITGAFGGDTSGDPIRYADVWASSHFTERVIDHVPERVVDGSTSTAWTEDAPGSGEGEYLVLELETPRALSGMVIYGGYHKTADLYNWNCRPKEITLTFSDGYEEQFTLRDVMWEQELTFSRTVFTDSVTITFHSVYEGSKYEDLVISEVELLPAASAPTAFLCQWGGEKSTGQIQSLVPEQADSAPFQTSGDLVTDAYTATPLYEGYQVTCEYHIPQVNADLPQIAAINQTIYDELYNSLYSGGGELWAETMQYTWCYRGSMLSIVVRTRPLHYDATYYNIFNIDMEAGVCLSMEEAKDALLKMYNISEKKYEQKMVDAINESYDQDIDRLPDQQALLEEARAWTLREENREEALFYINADGELTSVVSYQWIAGGSQRLTVVVAENP